MKNKIFIALDCDLKKAKSIIKAIPKKKDKNYLFIPKIGYQIFFAKGGREFINSLKQYDVFLDIKLHDIENTMKNAMISIKDLKNVKYITVHLSSGSKGVKAVKKFAHGKKILGVTTLTNHDNKSIKEIGYNKKISQLIMHQAKMAKKLGCYGVICSGKESLKINKIYKLKTITPGIRLPGDKKNDQRRVTTPKNAFFKQNSYGIVIGRSVTSGNLKNNFKKLLKHLER